MNPTYSFLTTDSGLTVFFTDGKVLTAPSDSHAYKEAVSKVMQGATDQEVRSVMNQWAGANAVFGTREEFEVTEHDLLYNGRSLHSSLARRALSMLREGNNADPLLAFLRNLMQNPRKSAIDSLYDFMTATDIPMTHDGHFVAYKIVRSDYTDIYSGKMNNSPGQTVAVNPNDVVEDRARTCAEGLHVCSRGYLPNYGSGTKDTDRIMIVKVNPAHVVAVPIDYNNSKMRVYQYKVIGEVLGKDALDILESRAVLRRNSDEFGGSASFYKEDRADGDSDSDIFAADEGYDSDTPAGDEVYDSDTWRKGGEYDDSEPDAPAPLAVNSVTLVPISMHHFNQYNVYFECDTTGNHTVFITAHAAKAAAEDGADVRFRCGNVLYRVCSDDIYIS